jgi:hypothetical protein
MASHGARGRPHLARSCLVFLLRGLLHGSILLFLAYLSVVSTRRWRDDQAWRRFPPDFGCSDELLDPCTLASAAWLAIVPAAGTLAACLLVGLLASSSWSSPSAANNPTYWWQRQVPFARHFWSRWCGGLSRQDALCVLLVAAVNAAWALSLGFRYEKLYRYFSQAGGGKTPPWALEAMLASIALGQMLMPNLALLFFPVARGSPLLAAAGVSYPSAVRAHRWLGHLTMALASAHSLGFWITWLARGQWTEEALSRGSRVNNLAGGASFLGGLALWVTSLERARRGNYPLFIATHHLGWWVFFLAGVAHYSQLAWWFMPGLVLYFVDLVAFRVASWFGGGSGGGVGATGKEGNGGESCSSSSSSSSSSVLSLEVAWATEDDQQDAAAAASSSSVVGLIVKPPKGFAAADAGIVWLRCPQVSWWQWHPFEYVLVATGRGGAASGGGGGGEDDDLALAMHIKAYGRWSRRFARLAADAAREGGAAAAALTVQVEAPYGDEPPHSSLSPRQQQHRSSRGPVVVLAGGIGATAALSLLRELAREREDEEQHEEEREEEEGAGEPRPQAKPSRRPVLFVWSARHAPEMAILLPRLVDAARQAGVDLDARLFFTGQGGARRLVSGWASAAWGSRSSPSGQQQQQQQQRQNKPQQLLAPPSAAASSQCPVLAPGRWAWQLLQRASAHALAAAGALAGMLLVRWLAVARPAAAAAAAAAAAGEDDDGGGWATAQAGLASAAAIVIGSALPALAVVVVARAAMAAAAGRRVRRQQQSGEAQLQQPLLLPSSRAAEVDGQQPKAALRLSFASSSNDDAAILAVVAPPPDADAAEGGAASLPVCIGRPTALEMRALVTDWLAAKAQDTREADAAVTELYAMGPEALVADARLLVDDMARQREEEQRRRRTRLRKEEAPSAPPNRQLPRVLFRLRTHEL